MAFFRIEEPNQPPKYIKSVDGANETLEFTNSTSDAYYKDSGFFADSQYEFLIFHFKNSYPELQYMKIDTGWHPHGEGVLNQVQEPMDEAAVGDIGLGGIDAVEEGPQEAPIGVADAEQFNAVYNGVGVADMAVGVNAAGG